MKLRYIDAAQISEHKITQYLLATDHPTGRSKALFFAGSGFRLDQPATLQVALLQHAAAHAVSSVQQSNFGVKYLIDGPSLGPA